MRNYVVKEIPQNSFFSKNVYLDKQFILTAPEIPFTRNLSQLLDDWGFKVVYSEGEPRADYYSETSDEFGLAEFADMAVLSDSDKMKRAKEFYLSLYSYVNQLFETAVIKNELNYKDMVRHVKTACTIIKEDRRFLFRVQEDTDPGPETNFQVVHAVKTMIISIVIGSYFNLPTNRLIDLGIAAILHEIGMFKLPPQIYQSKRSLSPKERKAILTHPVLGYNLLKSFDFPLPVSLVSLEHHERENGTGYPQKLTSDKISYYAKIIAVACSYEALTASRPHKSAKDGYASMLDLLKNEGKQYDELVVRALVFSLSIYPIGLYVLLSDGRKGQVIDVNPENPRFPIVQIFGEHTPDGKNKVVETSPDGINIVRPLTKNETDSQGGDSTATQA
ncbi:MAG: HD-GYP domain-containing protein [Treponema sp.]|jgi:HD-GYP domain-containing protein (c-di-GMP phosphodiesterase class II)|nr:HD-GYP domain-containing protein [Treponema sp.]